MERKSKNGFYIGVVCTITTLKHHDFDVLSQSVVARSSHSHPQPTSTRYILNMPFVQMSCFRGDADGLLDKLVEASKLPQATSWEERELQPWCPDDMSCSPMFSQPLEAPSPPRHYTASKHSRSPDHKCRPSAAAPKRARASTSPVRRCSLDAAQGMYACPSFAAAPKPEALPMPTSSLMTRALYRRSPSPPKMPYATAVMA